MTITLAIVIFTCLLSLSALGNTKLMNDLIFYPPAVATRRQYYRFVTHGFIHADFIHLAFNMIAFYSFGKAVEEFLFGNSCVFGARSKLFFVLLYFGGLIAASLPDYFRHKHDANYRSLGASGAVSGVVFAAILLVPQLPIRFFFIPIDIPGYVFGLLYLLVSAYLDRKGGGNINHSAHFWGAIFGAVFTYVCVSAFGQLDVFDNFMRQIRSGGTILPFQCNL